MSNTKIENLMGWRLEQLERIAHHFANLRLMAELGPVIALMNAFIGKIGPAQIGLRACEVELHRLRGSDGQWTDSAAAETVLKRRASILSDLRAAAKDAADKAGALAKMTKKATAPLYQGVTLIDNALHQAEELIEALQNNVNEVASVGITSVVAPITALAKEAEGLRSDAQTAAGLTFNWDKIRNWAIMAVGCSVLCTLSVVFLLPPMKAYFGLAVADTGQQHWLTCLVILATFLCGVMGVLCTVFLPLIWKEEADKVKKAQDIIARGSLPEDQDKEARQVHESFEVLDRVSACLGDGAAKAA